MQAVCHMLLRFPLWTVCLQGASTTTPGGLYGGPSNYGASPAGAGPPPVYGGVSNRQPVLDAVWRLNNDWHLQHVT